MDIGSGLTVETRTVNGKVTTGVFLNGSLGKSRRNKTKAKYPIRSKIDPDEKPKSGTSHTKQETVTKVASNQNPKQKIKKERTSSGRSNSNARKTTTPSTANKGSQEKSKVIETGENVKNPSPKAVPNAKKDATKSKGKENLQTDNPTNPQDINTKYVTLTQGQLNTILSLVKTKNEIDVSGVLESEDDSKDQGSKVTKVKGETEEKKADRSQESSNSDSDVRPTSQQKSSENGESIANLLNGNRKKSQDGVKDKKSFSRPSSKISKKNRGGKEEGTTEDNGKKSTEGQSDSKLSKSDADLSRESTNVGNEDLDRARKSQENLPAAMRSSFFLGEAAPREHAFSAKKRAEQQRWREELDKQRIEQQRKKESERNLGLKQEEMDSWTRHFDTMLPTKNSPRLASEDDSGTKTEEAVTSDPKSKHTEQSNKNDNASVSMGDSSKIAIAPLPSSGAKVNSSEVIENQDFASTMTNNSIPQRSSYLRTMTSLLDPAQIEALEVKRRKQDEHRKAIEAQVEERRRKKEEEEHRRRRLEAEEDMRLAADRDSLAQKTELEKLRHQMQENLREQKTRELYQQMKNAEESALRDKLSKREQNLKNKGHDTTKLERTHQMTLEMTHKVAELQPLAQASQASIGSNSSVLPALQLPQDGHMSSNLTPRQVIGVIGQSAPVAVTAQTEQGPIKLEISLNQRHAGEFVESAVQTDRVNERRNMTFDSDAETEYVQLPQKRRNTKPKDKNKKLQNFEKNLERQYDRHSRTDRPGQPGHQRQKRNGPRPKWGVGEKNKSFVPASQRYTTEQQRHDAVMRKREEKIIEPERLKVRPHSPRRNPAEMQSKSPPIPALNNRQRNEPPKRQTNVKATLRDRPHSGIYATSDQAKYRSEKHSRHSPVPETKHYVEYRRTTAVLDPNQPQSRPETRPMEAQTEFIQRHGGHQVGSGDVDPLLNPEILRQHERQEQILKEISILRQGLLIKQREVASYPAAMTHSMAVLSPTGAAPTNLVLAGGGNLPERTNDTPLM